jgi:acyl-CoA synthetase (AMP-forming)/AMP-acid ligase II
MSEYYGQPDKTAETIDRNGWLYSGDLGTMDAEGYVRITGRRKEMIIRGGENIYPAEIEEFLFTHPKVAQVAVFGIPDEFYGEVVMAWIQLHQGETATEQEMQEYCEGQILRRADCALQDSQARLVRRRVPDDGDRKTAEIPDAGNGCRTAWTACRELIVVQSPCPIGRILCAHPFSLAELNNRCMI